MRVYLLACTCLTDGILPEMLLPILVGMADQGLLRVDDLAGNHAVDNSGLSSIAC